MAYSLALGPRSSASHACHRLSRAVCTLAILATMLASRAAHADETHAYVLTTDYMTGSLTAVDLPTRGVMRDVASVYQDARIRWYDGLVYVVNRFGQDNIQVIDPAQNYATIKQFSVGNGSNPQDIAVVSPTKAYVTRLASARLLIVNPATGDSTGAISLAGFADADGIPDMDRMIVVGSRLFVSLGRLSNFQPTDSSLVVAIDLATDTVLDADPASPGVQGILLPASNPVTRFVYDRWGGRLAIGCAGNYGALDGGVAWVDPFALTSLGFAITESALQGDVLDVVLDQPSRAFAITSDASFNTSLAAWNPETGQRLSTLFSPGGFSLADAGLDDRDELYVCDNDMTHPGLYVFSASTGGMLAGPLDTGLPPVEVTFDRSADLASAPTAAVGAVARLATPWPQPSTGGVHARLSLPRAAEVRLEVLDVGGRSVRALPAQALGAGEHLVQWDGRDALGRRAPPGVYLLAARLENVTITQKFVVSR